MMPDLDQVGEGQTQQEWQKVPEAPAIMVDTYPSGMDKSSD